jgi:hypothetical protein
MFRARDLKMQFSCQIISPAIHGNYRSGHKKLDSDIGGLRDHSAGLASMKRRSYRSKKRVIYVIYEINYTKI